jgi:3-dehydroquinate dehydratase
MPLVVNGITIPIDALNNASPVIKQVAADINGLESSAGKAGDGLGGLNSEVGAGEMTMMDYAGAVSMVTAAVTTLIGAYELGEIGAQNSRLMDSGINLARSYGDSMDNIIKSVSEASLGTVSNMSIIESSNKAMMLGVSGSAEELASLMEIAALRGRAMGISTTQAFDDMVRGIGRMSPMILDNLGIVVDAEGTYGAYADSIGKSSSELTRSEKIQALLNKVIDEGNKLLEDAGGLVDDNAAKYERLEARVDNYQATLAMAVDNAINPSIEAFLDMSDAMDRASEATGYTDQRSRIYLGAMQLEIDKQKELEERILSTSAARMTGLASMYETVTAAEDVAAAFVTVAGADEDAVKGAIKVQEAYDEYGQKLSDLQLDHDELLLKKDELIAKYGDESFQVQTVNDKLAENEQKQKDVTTAMQGTLDQMLINTAMAGLDAEAQLALARSLGQIDEEAYAALSAQQSLKKQYDDGIISAQEYADKSIALRDAIARLESKKVTITVDAILNEIRNSYQNAIDSDLNNYGGGRASGGPVGAGKMYEVNESGVPELLNYNDRQFLMMPNSGNGFVSPLSGSGGGAGLGGSPSIVFAPVIQNLFGNQGDIVNTLYPAFIQMLEMSKADGYHNG